MTTVKISLTKMHFTTKNKSNATFTTFSLLVERNGSTSCI